MTKDEIFSAILGKEGGYVNNPVDKGGPTSWGITQAVARAHGYTGDMKDLTRQHALNILESDYWMAGRHMKGRYLMSHSACSSDLPLRVISGRRKSPQTKTSTSRRLTLVLIRRKSHDDHSDDYHRLSHSDCSGISAPVLTTEGRLVYRLQFVATFGD